MLASGRARLPHVSIQCLHSCSPRQLPAKAPGLVTERGAGALIHYLEPLLLSPDWTDHMVNFNRITHEPGKRGSLTNVLDSEILSFAREYGSKKFQSTERFSSR